MTLTPDLLLKGYAMGIFPMAEGRDTPEIFWVDPQERGILPLDGFHLSRSLKRRLRAGPFEITINQDFDAVVMGCADRPETWINGDIQKLYGVLHQAGYAHSLEVWSQGALVGGVYGVVLGAAFFGESMFSRRTDASKVALAYLIHRLIAGGFELFDTQFVTDHLISLGAIEITRNAYHQRLRQALPLKADFCAPETPHWSELVSSLTSGGSTQRKTHTSYRA